MTMTTSTQNTTPFTGFPVHYYPARMSEQDLCEAEFWAKFCRMGDASPLLAAYIYAAVAFERERRDAVESGAEIIECQMPEVPANHWTGPELAAALGKVTALVQCDCSDELNLFWRKLSNCIIAETQCRLGMN
jgi:hypothetical protein